MLVNDIQKIRNVSVSPQHSPLRTRIKQFCVVKEVFMSLNSGISLREEAGFQSGFGTLDTHNSNIQEDSYSEKRMPTVKLFGLKKIDYIKTPKGIGFIKEKRSDGYFSICDIFWNIINGQGQIKKNHVRLSARTTILTERRKAHSSMWQASVVPCA